MPVAQSRIQECLGTLSEADYTRVMKKLKVRCVCVCVCESRYTNLFTSFHNTHTGIRTCGPRLHPDGGTGGYSPPALPEQAGEPHSPEHSHYRETAEHREVS